MFFIDKKSRSFKYSLGVLLYIALALITTLLAATSAHAKTAAEMSADELAQSYSYYQVLGQCVGNNMKGDISIGAGDNGNALPVTWFDNNTASGNVYTERNIDCKNIADKALALWGWGTNGGQFLKDMGYRWDPSGPAYHGPGGAGFSNQRRDMFFNAVKSKVYSGRNPSITQPAEYLMYFEAAKNQPCSMQKLGLYSQLNETHKAWVDSGKTETSNEYTTLYRKATLVGDDQKASEFGISVRIDSNSTNEAGSFSSSTTYNSYGYRGGGGDVGGKTESCAWYIDNLSRTAGSFADYAVASNITPPGTAGNEGGGGDNKSSCVVEGVGWIVCPVSNFLAGITDGLFGVLTLLLATSPMGTDNPTYRAWTVMRNIANVAFVIVFIVIIFSQLTSAGVSNYGIKKLLPRLITAAILVNISYFICALAVDVSNILGTGLQGIFKTINSYVTDSTATGNNLDVWGDLTGWVLAGGAVTGAGVAAVLSISAAGGWLAALALLLPILITTLFAIITVVLVLAARQALIIILIAISPLAFVAYLLPNTEEWFDRWRKLFMTMLLLFPIISVIFGGSQLAATIIRNGTDNPLIYILSLAVQVVPFFLLPIIMKFSGGILNRFGGIVNNPNKGPFDRLRKSAQNFGETQKNRGRAAQLNRYKETGRGGAVTRWQMRRKAEQNGVENVLKRAEAGYVAEQIQSDDVFRNRAAGGTSFSTASPAAQQSALAGAVSALDKIRGEEVAAAKILIEDARLDAGQRQALALTGSVTTSDGKVYTGSSMQKAAIEEQMIKGSYKEKLAIIESSGTEGMKAFSQTIAAGARSMAAQNPGLGGKTLGLIEDGKIQSQDDIRNAMFGALNEGKFTASSIADMHDDARELLINVAASSTDPAHHAALTAAVEKIYSTPELSAKVAGNERAVGQLEQLKSSGQTPGQGTLNIPTA